MKTFKFTPSLVIFQILVSCTLLLLQGCLTPRLFYNKRVDVTNQPKWWGALHKGEIMQLKQDALLGHDGLSLSPRITTNHGAFGVGITVEQYQMNPDQYRRFDVDLIRKGTHVKYVRLERFFSSEDECYFLYVEIMDGKLKGEITAVPSMGDPRKSGTLELNAPFLEPVQK